MTIEQLYQHYLATHTVTTDSRAITPGCLFFAFSGAHFDGNQFARTAIEQGASISIVSDPSVADGERIILVDDVLKTLQQLALHHRNQLDIPVIGITGTNGKTTTKELINAVLSKRFRTHATQGNFNNHLGVPLTLLGITEQCEIAIVEMGANHPGEIEELCNIAQPTHGLITNVGRAHLEGFGDFEGVVRTKTELYRHLAWNHGTMFVNADNERLTLEAEKLATLPDMPSPVPGYLPGMTILTPEYLDQAMTSTYTYGSSADAITRGTFIDSAPYLRLYFENEDNLYNIQTRLLGAYNFDNAMAAISIGLFFGVDPFDIKEALEQYEPSNRRSQFKKTEHNTLYLDCYNANPSSMDVAIRNFEQIAAEHKTVILGGMKELGSESMAEHKKITVLLKECHFERIMLIGEEFPEDNDCRITRFATTEEAFAELERNPIKQSTILLKGSNSNKLWTLEQIL